MLRTAELSAAITTGAPGFQEELAVFGTLDRVSGHMTVFWRNPKDNAKMAIYSELECSAAKRLF